MLGSDLWARLLRIIGEDVAAEGATWSVVSERAGLRFGQAGPLRLVGAAHRLALAGDAPEWAALLPSCGGTAPAVGSGEGSDVGSGEGSVVGSDVGSDDRELPLESAGAQRVGRGESGNAVAHDHDPPQRHVRAA